MEVTFVWQGKNRTPKENAHRAKIRELLPVGNISSIDDIQNFFKETIDALMENDLEAELKEELGYNKYDRRKALLYTYYMVCRALPFESTPEVSLIGSSR